MIGLIPAAGYAERWGGSFIKEFLPVGNKRWLLDTAIYQLAGLGCDRIIIVSNTEKLAPHMRHVRTHCPNTRVTFTIGGDTMWESIKRGLQFAYGDDVILRMPDTLVNLNNRLDPIPRTDIKFGVFRTNQPDRFSVLYQGTFQKGKHIPEGDHIAWGMVSWQGHISQYFLDGQFQDFDTAFNSAKEKFETSYFGISSYTDFASFEDYKRWIMAHQ